MSRPVPTRPDSYFIYRDICYGIRCQPALTHSCPNPAPLRPRPSPCSPAPSPVSALASPRLASSPCSPRLASPPCSLLPPSSLPSSSLPSPVISRLPSLSPFSRRLPSPFAAPPPPPAAVFSSHLHLAPVSSSRLRLHLAPPPSPPSRASASASPSSPSLSPLRLCFFLVGEAAVEIQLRRSLLSSCRDPAPALPAPDRRNRNGLYSYRVCVRSSLWNSSSLSNFASNSFQITLLVSLSILFFIAILSSEIFVLVKILDAGEMKVKVISRSVNEFTRERSQDLQRVFRNYDPSLRPQEKATEYVRALNAAKLDKIFARPFIGAMDGHIDAVSCMAKNPNHLKGIFSGSMDGGNSNLAKQIVKQVVAIRCLHKDEDNNGGQFASSQGIKVLFEAWLHQQMVAFSYPVEAIARKDRQCVISDLALGYGMSLLQIFLAQMACLMIHPRAVDHQLDGKLFATAGAQVDIWDRNRSQPVNSFEWGKDTAISVRFNPAEPDILATSATYLKSRNNNFYEKQEFLASHKKHLLLILLLYRSLAKQALNQHRVSSSFAAAPCKLVRITDLLSPSGHPLPVFFNFNPVLTSARGISPLLLYGKLRWQHLYWILLPELLVNDRSITLYDLRMSSPARKFIMKTKTNAISWNPREPMNFTVMNSFAWELGPTLQWYRLFFHISDFLNANEDCNCYSYDSRKLSEAKCVHQDHVSAVMDIDYSPTGQEFVTGSYDRTVRIFKYNGGHSREIYHTKRMQRVFCVKFSCDASYVISGSDDTNLRLWKAKASEQLGVLLPREQKKQYYLEAVKERYKHLPEVRRIIRHRHLPKPIYKATTLRRTMVEAERRKEERRRAHSAPGSMPREPFRQKRILAEVE
ncbi:hypothetical protein ACLOJK_010368 [Asimina triloba]